MGGEAEGDVGRDMHDLCKNEKTIERARDDIETISRSNGNNTEKMSINRRMNKV